MDVEVRYMTDKQLHDRQGKFGKDEGKLNCWGSPPKVLEACLEKRKVERCSSE